MNAMSWGWARAPAGLACAYYLGLMGCTVDLYVEGEGPGSRMLQDLVARGVPRDAIERDLRGVLKQNIRFRSWQ